MLCEAEILLHGFAAPLHAMSPPPPFKPEGQVFVMLVTQTLIGEASRLLDGLPVRGKYAEYFRQNYGLSHSEYYSADWWFAPSNLGRLLNLASHTDNMILNERVLTLKGHFPPDLDNVTLSHLAPK